MSRAQESEDWERLERVMARRLGFRIAHTPGSKRLGSPDSYHLQQMDWTGEVAKVRAQRPVEQQAYELWNEAVRLLRDYERSAKLAWEVYSAAMGVTVANFNGMPEGGPIEAVRAERERLAASGKSE